MKKRINKNKNNNKIKYIKGYIRKGLQKGKSANQILKELKKQGKGIQRKRFLELVREIKGIEKKTNISNIKKTALITEKNYEPSKSYTKDRYFTIFKYKVRGEKEYRFYGIYHSELMKRKDLEQIVINNIKRDIEIDAEKYTPSFINVFHEKDIIIKPYKGYKRALV